MAGPPRVRRLVGSLWRLVLGGSREMGTASEAERLYNCLYPGQYYSPDKSGQLAGRLRRIAEALEAPGPDDGAGMSKRRRKDKELGRTPRQMDFSTYQQRYVALEVLYLGQAYSGFARQDTTTETIEGKLFEALEKTKLVAPGAAWQDLRYSRGGRTDKGVSALGQVVALLLRSSARTSAGPDAPPGAPPPGLPPPEGELDYPALLNRALPRDVRVLGWADAPADFSARFSATQRQYKYFMVQRPGQALDLEAMRQAAAHFIGEHDFRNFCKVDAEHVTSFVRSVLDFRIGPAAGCAWPAAGASVLELHIRGTAFLWHQVRCMVAVLAMVGAGLERPDVVASLLDVSNVQGRPQYAMASDAPLLLYACDYGDGTLAWRRTDAGRVGVAAALQKDLDSALVRSALVSAMLERVQADPGLPGGKQARKQGAAHTPLLSRVREPPVHERLAKAAAAKAAAAAAAGGGGEPE